MKEFIGYKKGINLGGWLSQCGEENYNDTHYSSFITEQDFKQIADAGFDHVRLPIDYNVIQNEDGSFINSGFGYIDNAIEYCKKYKLNIILDLHKTKGYIFDDKNYCHFFGEEALQENFYLLWEHLAIRYGNKKNTAFELLNEVTDQSFAEKWNDIIEIAVERIRKITIDTKIVYGGIYNNSIYGMSLLKYPKYDNIVFTFHCYSPMIFTHQKAYWVENMPSDYLCEYPLSESYAKTETQKIFNSSYDNEFEGENMISELYFDRMFKNAVEIAEKYNVPLYCGEYGVIDRADTASTLNWFNDIHNSFNKLKISRAIWNYRSKDFGIFDEHYKDILNCIY